MSFHSWLQNFRSALVPRRGQHHLRRRGSPRAARHRPNLEVLEDRLTPSFSGPSQILYEPPVVWATGPLLADFTSDGILDRISSSWYEVVVRPGRGDGTFGDPIITRHYPPWEAAAGGSMAVADFNGDGRLDAVTAGFTGEESPDGYGSVVLGRGDGTFDWFELYHWPLIYPASIGTGDISGTGWDDVAVAGYDYNTGEQVFAVLVNNGDWGYPPPTTPNLSIDDATWVWEGNAGAVSATFAVTLSRASSEAVSVNYATANGTATAGSDYQAASGTLTFAPGQTSATVTVAVTGDRMGEPNEKFVINLSNPTNAIIVDGQGTGTILDDEPRITISDVALAEGQSGTTLFTFTVTLSAPFTYDQPVTMSFRTTDGTARKSDKDYIAKTGTLTFAPGETTKTITIEVKGDSKKEADETFYLDLFGNSGNSLFTKNRGIGTILNDD